VGTIRPQLSRKGPGGPGGRKTGHGTDGEFGPSGDVAVGGLPDQSCSVNGLYVVLRAYGEGANGPSRQLAVAFSSGIG
jgi:hypothetical protein